MVTSIIEFYERFRISPNDRLFDKVYLEELFYRDNKRLQFIIFYYYLINANIPADISSSYTINLVVNSLVKSIEDREVHDYYSSYFSLDEIDEQWRNIYNEVSMFKAREEKYNQLKID